MSEKLTLLPCPFCGGRAEILSIGVNARRIDCPNCDASIVGNTEARVVAVWNRRATVEHWAEAAFNEGWRSREARPGKILNSRSEMRKTWMESNARTAMLDGEPDEH